MQQTAVEKNKIYQAEITSFTSEGNGICRINDFAVFVSGAVLGDVLEIKIVKVNKSYAYAKILNIMKPSPHRTAEKCGYAKKCGGCKLMHIDYNFQLEMKKTIVSDALERIGGFSNVKVNDTIGMEYPYEYRNKMQFPVSEKDGKIVCGFYRERSHDIVDIKSCITGPGVCESIVFAVKEYMRFSNTPPYNEANHSGAIRNIFIRTAKSGVMVVVVSRKKLNSPELLTKLICEKCSKVVSVYININDKKTNLILGDKYIHVYGEKKLTDVIGDFKFEISPSSFYQINPLQTQKLYSAAAEFANPGENETVVDLYCGIGTISMFMAKKAKKVIGIEIVPQAIENAKENAKKNGLGNLSFYCGDAGKLADFLYKADEKADIVVFDPPRKGADELALNTILKLSPKKIVYVSCNPSTLARDLKYLAQNGGYELKKVQPVDMFCHTTHVETVCLMCKPYVACAQRTCKPYRYARLRKPCKKQRRSTQTD